MQCRAIYSPAGREASFGGGLCTGCSHQNTLRGAMTTWQQQRLYLHALAWVGRDPGVFRPGFPFREWQSGDSCGPQLW